MMTEKITVEGLAKLFKDNVWKLYRLPESVISDRRPQFMVELMKESNKMLEIETKLSMAFHLQTDEQIERTNQELEQYLRMYINYRQSNWLEWLATIKFAFNNKVYTSTKFSLFKANYKREPRMGFEIRKKGKHVKAEKFMKEMNKMHEEMKVVMVKLQKEIKKYTDINRKEAVEYNVGDKKILGRCWRTQEIQQTWQRILRRKLEKKR